MLKKRIYKIILVLAFILTFSLPHRASAAPAVLHFASSGLTGAASTTISQTITSTTAGNLLVVSCSARDRPDGLTVSDGGDTFTRNTGGTGGNNMVAFQTNDQMGVAYSANIAGGATTVTCTFNGNSVRDRSIMVWELSGMATTSALDVQAELDAQGPNPNGASVTTTNASDLIISTIIADNQITGGTGGGCTSSAIDTTSGLQGMAGSYKIVSSTGTYQCTWTNSSNSAAITMAFKAATGGGSNIKTIIGLAIASVKTSLGLAIASMKSRNGLQ